VLEREGRVSREEMHRVFNMGIGMVLLVSPDKIARASDLLGSRGEAHYFIGNVVAGQRRVTIDFV
jgi:phosphoribosylformylglycinamidine cyclo-ligase